MCTIRTPASVLAWRTRIVPRKRSTEPASPGDLGQRSRHTANKENGDAGFPIGAIERTMGEVGKSLGFDGAAVDGLLQLRYRDRNCFPLLSLIYPRGDTLLRHVDHVYLQTAFTHAKLKKLGMSGEQVEWTPAASQAIPNLQLLTPADNESKGDRFPLPWLETVYPDANTRTAIAGLHHFGELGDSLHSFPEFFEQRRSSPVVRSADVRFATGKEASEASCGRLLVLSSRAQAKRRGGGRTRCPENASAPSGGPCHRRLRPVYRLSRWRPIRS